MGQAGQPAHQVATLVISWLGQSERVEYPRWMGHHLAAFTLETYGHLIDGDLGPALDLRKELRPTNK